MISLDDDMLSASDDGKALQQDEEFLLSPSDENDGGRVFGQWFSSHCPG